MSAKVLPDNIGYIRLSSFQETTQKELIKAIKTIKKDTKNKVRGYILDLRNNPGGLLTKAISVSDTFLTKGDIVSVRGRDLRDSYKWSAHNKDLIDGLPLVVIINRGSASASEIVAAALKENKRAIIIGEKSFGKGSVQTVMELGKTEALKLTTALYYTPDNKSIQGTGVSPNITIKHLKIEKEYKDAQYSEKSLKGALKNTEKKEKNNSKNTKDKKDDTNNTKVKDEKSLNLTDYILARGINILNTLIISKDLQK